jgi:hypothetical protein
MAIHAKPLVSQAHSTVGLHLDNIGDSRHE